MMRIGVLGLGNMGAGMAATLVSKGFSVSGFDLSSTALAKAAQQSVKIATSAAELTSSVDLLILSLPKAEHVRAACLDDGGIFSSGNRGLIVVDTTTSTPEMSREMAGILAEKGIDFMDAPVSGGPAGAASGTMTMVIGAKDDALTKALPVLEAMSGTRVHVGDVGAGNVVKIANNLLSAAHLITTAEAISLAAQAGVEPDKCLAGINAGSGRSAVSQASFPRWITSKSYDSGFTMGLMRKDTGLALALADQLGMALPLSREAIRLWGDSRSTLADSEDFNCIVLRTDSALFGKEK